MNGSAHLFGRSSAQSFSVGRSILIRSFVSAHAFLPSPLPCTVVAEFVSARGGRTFIHRACARERATNMSRITVVSPPALHSFHRNSQRKFDPDQSADLTKCYPVKLGEALPWCCVPLLRRIAVRAGRRAWRSF